MARRKLVTGRIQLWGHPIAVDWAEPEEDVDDDVMKEVKVLYVRNLLIDTSEDILRNHFQQFGKAWFLFFGYFSISLLWAFCNHFDGNRLNIDTGIFFKTEKLKPKKVERVKKIRDYAFIHFVEREGAEVAMDAGEQQNVDGSYL